MKFNNSEINIILAGQSNAIGRNDELEGQPSDLSPDGVNPNASYYNGTTFLPYALNMNLQGDNVGGWGIEYRVAKYLGDKYDKPINLLKCALGGSNIGENGSWDHGEDGTIGHMTQLLIDSINSSAKTYDVLIWIQGENDATTAELGDAYEDNLTKFLARVRLDVNQPILNVIVVKLGEFPSSNIVLGKDAVKVAQMDVVSNTINTELVTPDTYATFRTDKIHYDSDSLDVLGNYVALTLADEPIPKFLNFNTILHKDSIVLGILPDCQNMTFKLDTRGVKNRSIIQSIFSGHDSLGYKYELTLSGSYGYYTTNASGSTVAKRFVFTGEWNSIELTVVNGEITVLKDGVETTYLSDAANSSGFIHSKFTLFPSYYEMEALIVRELKLNEENFPVSSSAYPYLQVIGSEGTVGDVITENLNGVKYVQQYMHGDDKTPENGGVGGGLKFDPVNNDYFEFTPAIPVVIGDVIEYDFFLKGEGDSYSFLFDTDPRTLRCYYIGSNSNKVFIQGVTLEVDGVMYANITYDSSNDIGKRKIYKFEVTNNGGIDVVCANSTSLNFTSNIILYGIKLNGVEILNPNGLTIDKEIDYTTFTSHVDGQLYIDNEMHRAIGSGDPTLATLTTPDIQFDNGATGGSLTDAEDYTDSLGAYYPLNEAEGLIAFSDTGDRGVMADATWVAKVLDSVKRFFGMTLSMGLSLISMRGK